MRKIDKLEYLFLDVTNYELQIMWRKQKTDQSTYYTCGIFRPLNTTNKAPEIFSNTNGVFPKKISTGIYDKDILCEQCDRCIGLWDDYANKILIQNFSEKCAVYHKGIKVAYKIDNYDYKKLKLFFISLLWRALISEREFYKKNKHKLA